MTINITTINTTDILTTINIIATSLFSFLIWRATVATNKTTQAINKSSEQEKQNVNKQNRYLVKYHLSQIFYELNSHSETKSIRGNGIRNIKSSIEEIKNFNLTLYFNPTELEQILDYIGFMESKVVSKLKNGRAYAFNPFDNSPGNKELLKEQRKKHNIQDMPIIVQGKEKTEVILKKI